MKGLLSTIWRMWRHNPEKVRVSPEKKPYAICARVGESLAPPTGSVVRQCSRCQNAVTIAPLTLHRLVRMAYDILCIQCAAAEDPNTPITPLSPEDIEIFRQHRGGEPIQCIQTVGEMNEYMNFLFPGRSDKP